MLISWFKVDIGTKNAMGGGSNVIFDPKKSILELVFFSKNAIFSFYKHTYDKPLFQIEKIVQKRNNYVPEFSIVYKKKILEKNKSLNIVINRLAKKFKILKLH